MGHQDHFSTDMSNLENFKTVNVTSLNAFPEPGGIDNKEITFENGINYRWTKPMTAAVSQDFRFRFPDAGSVSLSTSSAVSNSLTTGISSGATLFTGTPDRVIIDNLDIFASDGGKWVDLTGAATAFPNLFLTGSRVQGFDSIGNMDSMGYLSENVSYFFNGEGLTMNDMLLVALDEQNFAGQVGDHLIFTGSLFFATLRSVLGTPSTGDSLYNFASNLVTGGIQIPLGAFNPAGGGTMFAAGGLNETSPAIRVTDVLNTNESNSLGTMGFLDNAIDTVIVTVDTYTDIAGTIVGGADNERFTLLNGVLTYIGLDPKKFIISVNISLKKGMGASARTVRAALFIDTGSGFVEGSSAPLDMDNNIKSFGFIGVQILNTGDKLKIQVKNETNEDDILIITYDLVVNKA